MPPPPLPPTPPPCIKIMFKLPEFILIVTNKESCSVIVQTVESVRRKVLVKAVDLKNARSPKDHISDRKESCDSKWNTNGRSVSVQETLQYLDCWSFRWIIWKNFLLTLPLRFIIATGRGKMDSRGFLPPSICKNGFRKVVYSCQMI